MGCEDEQFLFTVEVAPGGGDVASLESLPLVVVRSVAAGGKALSVDPAASAGAGSRKHKLVFQEGAPSTSALCQWFLVEDADNEHILLL